LLETKPFSSKEKECMSENIFKEEVIKETTQALRKENKALEITYLLDRGFDDQKIICQIIERKCHFILRVSHTDRLIQYEGKQMKLNTLPFKEAGVKQYQK